MKEKTLKKLILVFFIAVFLTMLVFNAMTPMISDDFAHYFSFDGTHITTLSQMLENLPLTGNSRYIPHFLVFFFQTFPRPVFWIVNAFFSVCILFCLFRFFRIEAPKRNLVLLIAAVCMLWYFTPGFGQIYLWLTGACNYSWGLLLDLIFIYPFYCIYIDKPCRIGSSGNNAAKFFYLILAFVVGAYSESGGMANIAVIAVLEILIWHKNRKLPVYLFTVFLSACAGFACLMLAPSAVSNAEAVNFADNAKNCITSLQKYCLIPFIIYAVFAAFGIMEKVNRRILISSGVLVIAGIASVLVFTFAQYLPARSFMIVITYTVLAILILAAELLDTSKKWAVSAVAAGMVVVFACSFILGAGDILSLFLQSRQRETKIEQSINAGELDVELEKYASSTMYPAQYDEELTDDPNYYYNDFVAKYYGLNSVVAAEESED